MYKRVLMFGVVIIGLATALPSAFAVGDTIVATGAGTCVVMKSDCKTTPDPGFTLTSVSVKSSGGITTLICSGTTTNKPTKAAKCDGETLNGTTGDTPGSLTNACAITLGSTTVDTDDWQQVVSASGNVKLICKSGGTDTK